jgi:GNAT superfamily N-acetyltransferase
MGLQHFPSAAAFLHAAEAHLLQDEAENNLILGLAGDLAAGRAGADNPYFVVGRRDGEIVFTGFSTVPDKVGVTRSRDDSMLHALASDLIDRCPGMRVVLGPEPTGRLLAQVVGRQLGTTPQLLMSQRIHELHAVQPPDNLPPGRLRAARDADTEVVIEWVAAFMEHAGEQGDAAALARDRIGRGLLYLWEADGPVSMAAWTGKTPNGVRVNLVYTPPALRGKGYATACVTGLSTLLLQHNRFCCLYTDLANPTSNAIYHRIGYRPVCDAAVYLVRDEGLS